MLTLQTVHYELVTVRTSFAAWRHVFYLKWEDMTGTPAQPFDFVLHRPSAKNLGSLAPTDSSGFADPILLTRDKTFILRSSISCTQLSDQ
jgi:hypothetical protein